MAEDEFRTRAAAYVDSRFRVDRFNLLLEHRRQEQRQLFFHKAQLESHARNRETAELRYAERLNSIEKRHDRIADRLRRRHNSIGGRLQALTKKGRANQAEQLERLDHRVARLQGQAHQNFAATQERQLQAEQRDRTMRARALKLFRQDHLNARRTHVDYHAQTRDAKIEVREEQLRQIQQQERQLALAWMAATRLAEPGRSVG